MIFMGFNASAGTQVYNTARAAIDRVRGISVTPINPGVTVTPINPNLTVTPLSGLGSIVNAIRRGADRAIDVHLTDEQLATKMSQRGMNGLGLDYGFTRGMLGEADSGIVSGLTVVGLLGLGALVLAFATHEPKRRRNRR